MAFCIIMTLGQAGASQYQFGAKVTSFDSDFGAPLHPYGAPNPGPWFSLGYWDTGVVLGYDETDVVYLHQGFAAGPPGRVLANDVRLTPFDYLSAGSKVTPQDNDIGMQLIPLDIPPFTATIGWVDSSGGPGNNLGDPVYVHPGNIFPGTTPTKNYDVRLSEVAGKPPGSKVANLDPDLPKIFSIGPIGSPNPIIYAGVAGVIIFPDQLGVQYVDNNGNNQYDYPDDVYLITGLPRSPAVRVNDVRLSGPAQDMLL